MTVRFENPRPAIGRWPGRKAAAAVVVASLSAWLAVQIAIAEPATSDATSCNGQDYGQAGALESDTYGEYSRGTSTNMWVSSGAPPCQRINSIYIMSPGGGSIEVGWINGLVGVPQYCNKSSVGSPTIFLWWQNDFGVPHCYVTSIRPTAGAFHTFTVSDENANSWWGAWLDGGVLTPDGLDLNFSRGLNVVAMERGMPNDRGEARWISLLEFHDGNQWTFWDNARPGSFSPQDPDYYARINNAHDVAIVPR